MPQENSRSLDQVDRRIRELESRRNLIISDSERSRLNCQVRDLNQKKALAEPDTGAARNTKGVTLWTPDGLRSIVATQHEHQCAQCKRRFSHDSQETACNEIAGKFYCDVCYETAAEHSHRCPVCGDMWVHSMAPDCVLQDVADCFRHGQQPSPGSRGLTCVAGMDRLKAQLYQDVVLPLRNPEEFRAYRLGIPNGILLFGPPGCGKTYIAHQLAEELDYFYQEVFPSEVGGTYIHETALKVRELFDRAADQAPAILFIDEFEGLVPSRSGLRADQSYTAEEVNEFLKQIESCAAKRILLIAATNEPWRIDAAVQRTGRLDIKAYVGPPDVTARTAMLKFHLCGRPLAAGIDALTLAKTLSGYSASDLKFLVDQAARIALRSRVPINTEHLWEAVNKVPASISTEDEERYKTFGERGAP